MKSEINAYSSKNWPTLISTKGKSSKTKCSENQFVSENLDDSESDWSIDSEGEAYSMKKYLAPKNTLTKHTTYNGREPDKLDLDHDPELPKRPIVNFKMRKHDIERFNESWSSRNGIDAKY